MLVHVDTDIGGNPDDVAALAMLAGWPDVELSAVTTVADPDGQRAGYARHCLDLLGRPDVPVVAGAEVTLADGTRLDPTPAFWPTGIAARPAPAAAATEALEASIRRGATVVTIGPLTNLARLERERPGVLATAGVVVMGGWLRPPDEGLPAYGPDRDWNVTCDPAAARSVFAVAGDLTLVTLADTLRTHLRAEHLHRLRGSGPLGRLLAEQAVAYARVRDHAGLAAAHAGLPDDLVAFLHDPLTCAVAVGWAGARLVDRDVVVEGAEGWLRLVPGPGRTVRVVDQLDAAGFADRWLRATMLSAGGAKAQKS